jgi:acyl carrier protein
VLQFDVTIMDGSGNQLVEVQEYTLRKVSDVALQLKGLSGESFGKVAANESLLSGAILSSEGVEAFRRVLAHGELAQVVISPMNVPSLISKWKPQGGTFIGQMAKLQLPKLGHARPDTGIEYQAPTNEIESMIADIWQSLLGIDRIGINDDFFALGGDSLMGIQVVSNLREAFHIELSPAFLFERPTVADLSESILQMLADQVNAEMLAEIEQLPD